MMLNLALRLESLAPAPLPSWLLAGASADLDFANGRYFTPTDQTLAGNLSCSRSSSGYAQSASGSLTSFGNNVPRITDQGLLAEEARTNLIPANENLTETATYWQYTGIGSATASGMFNGLLPFFTFTEDTNSTQHRTTLRGGVRPTLSASTYTATIFLRAGTRRYVQFSASNNVDGAGCVVDTQNWTVATATAGTGWTAVSASIAQLGTTGTYRAVLVFTAPAVTAAMQVAGNNDGTFAINKSYLGDGSTFVVAGFQIELGAFPTSYIPTTTAAATRAADIVSLTGAAAASALASKGARFETQAVAGGSTPRLVNFNTSNGARLYFASSTQVATSNNSSDAIATIGGAGNYGGLVTSAFGFDSGSATARANGGSLAVDGNAWVGNTGAVYLANRSDGTRALNGYMRRATFGPTKGMFDALTV